MHLNTKVKAHIFILLPTNFNVRVGICHTTGEENGGSEAPRPQALQIHSVFSLSSGRIFCHIDFTCIKNSSLEMKDLDLSHYFRSELATELILKCHTHTNHISYVTNN